MAHILFWESSNPGSEVESEGQFDQLWGSGRDGGRIRHRRHSFLQVCIHQLLEGGVRHLPKEAV